jgi:hypothetical protein
MADEDEITSLEVVLAEARREHQAEVATIEEIDDKALRASRTAVLVVGFVVSALGIAGPSGIKEIDSMFLFLFGVGSLLLVTAALTGVITASVSRYPSGVGEDFMHDSMGAEHPPELTYRKTIHQYHQMTNEVADEVDTNEELLSVVQMTLGVGVMLLACGGLATAITAITTIPSLAAISAAAILVGLCVYGAVELSD